MAKEKENGMQEGKLKALQAAMAKIEKDFGKGSVMKLGDENIESVEVIPTGSISLNVALGVGGYPRGRIIEIYGPESSGKTTLAIHAVAEAQKMGLKALYVDAENAFDKDCIGYTYNDGSLYHISANAVGFTSNPMDIYVYAKDYSSASDNNITYLYGWYIQL